MKVAVSDTSLKRINVLLINMSNLWSGLKNQSKILFDLYRTTISMLPMRFEGPILSIVHKNLHNLHNKNLYTNKLIYINKKVKPP